MKSKTSGYKFLAMLAIAIACVPWSAYVMTVLWGWFLVPMGLHQIVKAQAFGICLMFSLVRQPRTEDGDKDIASKIGTALGGPALILLMGYIAHWFMT